MESFHETIFYILWATYAIICIAGDIKTYYQIHTGKLQKLIHDESKDFTEMNNDLATLFNPKTVRIFYAILFSIPFIFTAIMIFGMYYQARYFQLPELNRTIITLFLFQVVEGIFIIYKWPNQLFPKRKLTKPLLSVSIFFTIGNAIFLTLIILQTI